MVAAAPTLSANLERRALEATQKHHPEHYILYEQCMLRGQPLPRVARSVLGITCEEAERYLREVHVALAAWIQGLWNGEDCFEFCPAVTEEELALEALAQHHPTKALVYQAIVQGRSLKSVGHELGLAANTASCHLRDARAIVVAYQRGIWDGQEPFLFRPTARKLGVTEFELRQQLDGRPIEEGQCAHCGQPYKPSGRTPASRFCGGRCQGAAWRRQSGKTCPRPDCDAVIAVRSTACAAHYRLIVRTKECWRCGDPFDTAAGTRILYCPVCRQLVSRDSRRAYRERQHAARKRAGSSGGVLSLDEARRARKSRETWDQLPLPLDLDEPVRRRASR